MLDLWTPLTSRDILLPHAKTRSNATITLIKLNRPGAIQWVIFHAWRLCKGRDALGYGDFKLLAASLAAMLGGGVLILIGRAGASLWRSVPTWRWLAYLYYSWAVNWSSYRCCLEGRGGATTATILPIRVLSRSCSGPVTVLSRFCHGSVTVLSRSCH